MALGEVTTDMIPFNYNVAIALMSLLKALELCPALFPAFVLMHSVKSDIRTPSLSQLIYNWASPEAFQPVKLIHHQGRAEVEQASQIP